MRKLLLLSAGLMMFGSGFAQQEQSRTVNQPFNEQACIERAKAAGYNAWELKNYVERSRQEFISKKNNLPVPSSYLKSASTTTYNPGCTNIDFEAGTTSGWMTASGTNTYMNGSCTMAGCCPASVVNYTMCNNGLTDPNVGFPINSVFGTAGGTNFIKLNDDQPNFAIQQISQSFKVTSANNLFAYAFLLVFDGTGHACCDQPFYNFTLSDTLGNPITGPGMPNYSITVPGVSCPATASLSLITAGMMPSPSATQFSYTPWMISAIDLSPYIGNAVNISITVGDCTGGAHAAYMYFDAACASLNYYLGSTPYPLNMVNTLPAGPTYTITAPANFNTYTWTGPTGTYTTPSITTSMIGSYTLSLGGYGYSAPSQKVFNITSVTSISEQNAIMNAVTLYPNPSAGEVIIDHVPSKTSYALYDVRGKLITDKIMCSGSAVKLDVSGLETGVYFIKLESESGVRNMKFIRE
ncbi:MAG: T9SS type A sorting domain-containing protein [Bacteroidia bacterium]